MVTTVWMSVDRDKVPRLEDDLLAKALRMQRIGGSQVGRALAA
jgi:hypothetical protein